MSNNTPTQQITFWKYLQENRIEIPIIQRDYAQGRKGKEELRRGLLGNLKEALSDNKQLKLDFVYGSSEGRAENRKINPLDGQQRLTTLWLLHWYIALKAGKLAENEETFKHFSYETRVSSREFIERLCDKYTNNPEIGKLVASIQNQTWFYSEWKQDPTIQSMLRMLSGTSNKDKNGNEIIDGIEELFKETSNEKFIEYWNFLISETCPIIFYSLDLGELKLTDDLYIKMNARGEQLTSFENFKADLVGYIKEQFDEEVDDSTSERQKDNNKDITWKDLLDAKEGIPIKMDTTWTDIFWKNKSSDCRIDDIYFAFLNRYFLNAIIIEKNGDSYKFTADQIEKENKSFKFLYGNKSNDSSISYTNFEIYKYCEKEKLEHKKINIIPKEFLLSFQNTLNNFIKSTEDLEEVQKAFYPLWAGETDFRFIPKYKKDKSITTFTQPQRVVFFAICKYFEIGEYNEVGFKQWMRVVWNLVENANADTIQAMIGCMRLIDELSEHSHDIYKFLANEAKTIKSDANKDQVAEEREKARQILNDEKTELRQYDGAIEEHKGKTWENVIITAENYAFFKGSIRFLFRDKDRNWDWTDFDTKWKNAQKYFDENGVREGFKVQLTKALVIQCDNWDKQLYDKQIFNPNSSTWKWILAAKNWILPVHNILLLTNDFTSIQKSLKMEETIYAKYILPIIDSLPFEEIIRKEPDSRFRWHVCLGLYKPYGQNAITFDWDNFPRNKILAPLVNNKTIICTQKIDNCNFFWGWNINFKYNEYFFQWYYERTTNTLDVYLMEKDWQNYQKRTSPTTDKKTDEDNFYCFNVSENETEKSFIDQLNNLINQFNKIN